MTLVENTQISNLGTIAVSDASCRTLEAHSTLKEQQAEKFSQKPLVSPELMLLLSLVPFFFANVPNCHAAMEGDVSINLYLFNEESFPCAGGFNCLDI